MILKNLSIKKVTIIFLCVLVVLNIPGFLINITTIYHTEYKFSKGDFVHLSYSFNAFELLLCIVGILTFRKKTNCINMYMILIFVFIKDVFISFFGKCSTFYYHSFEMYLSVLVGMSACALVCKYGIKKDNIDKFLDWLVMFTFLYQILFLLTGKVQSGERVSSMSISYGAIGFTCALHIMYTLLTRPKNKKTITFIIISLSSLVLSGSRFSLLIILAGVIIFSSYIFKTIDKRKRWYIILALLSIFIILVFIFSNPTLQKKYDVLNRVSELFSDNYLADNIGDDTSFIERQNSIEIGKKIIKENPFGISNSFIELQEKTIQKGFFAFPHSYIICYYLLWGPIFIYCLYWVIKLIYKCFKSQEKGNGYFLLFFSICIIVYGGIETSAKLYTYIFTVISSINIAIKSINNKINEGINNEKN